MIRCRRIDCLEPVVGFVRVQYTYSDNKDAGQTEYDIDADWPYCRTHFHGHMQNHYSSSFEFHDTMEGYRC